MLSDADQLPSELIPVLDLIAEMVADAMIKEFEEKAVEDHGNVLSHLGKKNHKQEEII